MLGQQGCARLSPARPTFLLFLLLLLLLLLGAGVMAQDICSSPGHGDLPAPVFHMIPTAAEGGNQVILQCQISWKSPVTRIIFCKDGVEQYSLKALQGKEIYYTFFPMMIGNAGTFTCGYQHKDNSNRVRNSALSAPLNLSVTGSRSSSQAGTSRDASLSPLPNPGPFHRVPIERVVGVTTVTVLLAAASYCALKKGTCRERCQRQQQVSTHEAEVTDDNAIQYFTIAHVGHNRPRRQELNSSTEYAPVRLSHSQPR